LPAALSPAPQFKRDAVAAEGGAERQLAGLHEQKAALEARAAALQRQVDGLVLVGGAARVAGMDRVDGCLE
jgi:hypothetical protein